jgi:transcriptional regulator with XRE-family HTH domain
MTGEMPPWCQDLRAARKRVGIARSELARRSGVPVHTLRRWEDGTRAPTLQGLKRVLDALDCPNALANGILVGAGFAPSRTLFASDRFPNYFYTVEELQTTVETVPWPEFVLNDRAEVVAANLAIQAVWRVDYVWEKAHRTAAQMNLLSVASDHRFARYLVNWEEAIGALIGAFKASPSKPRSPDDTDDMYFNAVFAQFASGDAAFLRRLINTWQKTSPMEPKCRWTVPIVWSDEEFGEMRFTSVINTASEPDGLSFQDWVPIDAASWDVLERVKGRGKPSGSG